MNITREQLVNAFQAWHSDYMEEPTKYQDYDLEGYDVSKYATDSADVLITYLDKVKGENV